MADFGGVDPQLVRSQEHGGPQADLAVRVTVVDRDRPLNALAATALNTRLLATSPVFLMRPQESQRPSQSLRSSTHTGMARRPALLQPFNHAAAPDFARVPHADALHYGARTHVVTDRARHHGLHPEDVECKRQPARPISDA